MQYYYDKPFHSIQFEKAGYQQFLREQGLSEPDIRRLNIHLITDFTYSHFKGCVELTAGGAFFRRGREYVEQENKRTFGLYRAADPPRKYAAIFLRPARHYDVLDHLNRTFLHETRHHIQYCLKLPCCSTVSAGVANEAHSAEIQPWEIDAHQFAKEHHQLSFLSYTLTRSDLLLLRAEEE